MSASGNTLNPISFQRRRIILNFKIVRRDGVQEHIAVDGQYRIRAIIANAGMNVGCQLEAEIEGLSLSTMNKMCTVEMYQSFGSPVIDCSASTVTVRAGVEDGALATVFAGNIGRAYVDYAAAPSVIFRVSAWNLSHYTQTIGDMLGYARQLKPIEIISDICTRNNIILVDHGGWEEGRLLSFNYLYGDSKTQISRVIDAVRGYQSTEPNGFLDRFGKETLNEQILHVWGPLASHGEGIRPQDVPVVSAETGMIGYPQYSPIGCVVRSIFRPEFAFNGHIKLESAYLPAGWSQTDAEGYNAVGQPVAYTSAQTAPWNGFWIIRNVKHDISCEIPGGPWLTEVECSTSFVSANLVKS